MKSLKEPKLDRIPWQVKQEIWNLPCCICDSRRDVEIDHIIPASKGGLNDRKNLQPLCETCNRIKGSRLTNEQTRKIRFRRMFKA